MFGRRDRLYFSFSFEPPLWVLWGLLVGLGGVGISLWADGQSLSLRIMGWGIGVMELIVAWCARLPGAAIHMPHMPKISLLLIVAGGLWLCLWRYKWRWLGIVPIFMAAIPYSLQTLPSIFISETAKVVGIYESGDALCHHASHPFICPISLGLGMVG